jgi:hypothetical protein
MPIDAGAFLLKLSCVDVQLKPNPPDSTFTIHVELVGIDPSPLTLETIDWIPEDTESLSLVDPVLIPLKSMDCGSMKMQLYCEESELKPDTQA